GLFLGVANPITTRNQILANGTWGFVSSGHPNPALEGGFQVHRRRARSAIWLHATGSMSCATDARGNPTSSVTFSLPAVTRFPSHRTYWYRINGPGPVFQGIAHNIAQGALSNL